MSKGKEIFLPVVGYEKDYAISNTGKLKRIFSRHGNVINKIHIGGLSNRGYRVFDLYKNGVGKPFLMHRLVAIAFIPNPGNKKTVNHINGIKTDNRVENLEWCTHRENTVHAFMAGLNSTRGVNHPCCTFSEDQVLEIFNSKESTINLAKKYKTSQSAIAHIKTGNSWSHLTGKNYNAKPRLEPSDVLNIFYSKLTYKKIKEQYKVSAATIYLIKFGKSHADVTNFENNNK